MGCGPLLVVVLATGCSNSLSPQPNLVYLATDGWLPVADVSYLGFFFSQSGMNENGIFFDLQNGAMSDPSFVPGLPDGNDMLFTFLARASTLDEMDELFIITPAEGGVIMNAADATEARVYEYATYDVRIRHGNGLLASSNHFINPDWGLAPLPDGMAGFYTNERLANLLQLGEANKGHVDVAVMQQIFDTTISQGGPTWDDGRTYHQIIADTRDGKRSSWNRCSGKIRNLRSSRTTNRMVMQKEKPSCCPAFPDEHPATLDYYAPSIVLMLLKSLLKISTS